MADARNPAQELADSEFTPQTRALIAPALRRSYAAVDKLIESVEWLQTPSAKFHRGDLIVLATEHEFARLIDKGSLPLEMSWEPYAAPTGKHLVMRSQRAVVTINQIENAKRKPRHAVFRDHYGLPNMAYLFDYMNEEIVQEKARKHLLLLHGYQHLSFSHLAIPHPLTSRLIWWSDNLLNIPHEVDNPVTPDEGPDESPDPQAIEDIIRAVRDSG